MGISGITVTAFRSVTGDQNTGEFVNAGSTVTFPDGTWAITGLNGDEYYTFKFSDTHARYVTAYLGQPRALTLDTAMLVRPGYDFTIELVMGVTQTGTVE